MLASYARLTEDEIEIVVVEGQMVCEPCCLHRERGVADDSTARRGVRLVKPETKGQENLLRSQPNGKSNQRLIRNKYGNG